MSALDRMAGGLLGVHAGDALGAAVEFSSWEAIRARYPDGLREIIGGGPFEWPPGHATDDTGSAGNGSLMRCIPTALAVTDRERRIRESMEISAITHDDPRCTVACAAYNEMAAGLLAGASPVDAVAAGQAVATELDGLAVVEAIGLGRRLRPAEMAARGPVGLADEARGFVLDSLGLAVGAVLDSRPLSEVLVDVVRVGNDTDTNGAIAGGLLGVRDGVAAIPDKWRSLLQFGDEFTAAARTLSGR